MKLKKIIINYFLGILMFCAVMLAAFPALAVDNAVTVQPSSPSLPVNTVQLLPIPPAKTSTVNTLQNLSNSISDIHLGAKQLVQWLHSKADLFNHIKEQLKDSHTRALWRAIFLQCLLVLGLSYLAFYCAQWGSQKLRQRLLVRDSKNFSDRIFNPLMIGLLSLFPIIVFVVVAYLSLILTHVGDTTQWILLAWVSAFLIVKLLMLVLNFVFDVRSAFLGVTQLNSQAQSFKNSLSKLVSLIVYGYFILQIVLYLGLSWEAYEILLKIFGFLVVVSLILLIINIPVFSLKFLHIRKTNKGNMIRAILIIYLLLLYLVWIAQADHFLWFVLKGTVLSLILLLLVVQMTRWVHRYLRRDFHIKSSLKKRLPGLEGRIRRYRKILDLAFQIFIYLLLAQIIIRIWGIDVFGWLAYSIREIWAVNLISIACILFVAALIWELCNSLIEVTLTKSGEDITIETGRAHTLLTVAQKTISITVSLIAGLMILSEIGVNIGPLLAGAGVLGLAVSFGAQKLVQDVITGFFMLLENQIAVGDVVRIADKSGTVEGISIRTVRLRDVGGVVHIIPYSSIVTVSNLTKDFSYYLFEIGVAYRENVDEVMAVLRQIAADLQQDPKYNSMILEPLEILGLDKFADSAVIIKARLKTKPVMQWQVGREFNRRMKQKFDELDIQIPFPHTVLFFGENKDGSAPPGSLQVALEKNPK